MPTADFDSMRRAMVESQLRTSGVTSAWILSAMGTIARENYAPAAYAAVCYTDRPLPMGNGAAMNPALVNALMLQEAEVVAGDKVLLIGDASGYVAALLRARGADVDAVADAADAHGTGYDLIYVDGAAEILPDALVALAADGGRIVTGIVDGAVTRLAIGHLHNGKVALRPFADAEIVRLPAFSRPKEFVF